MNSDEPEILGVCARLLRIMDANADEVWAAPASAIQEECKRLGVDVPKFGADLRAVALAAQTEAIAKPADALPSEAEIPRQAAPSAGGNVVALNPHTHKAESAEKVAVIDVGSSWIRCLLASVTKNGNLTIINKATVPSAGMRKGYVTEIEKLSLALQKVCSAATGPHRVEGYWISLSAVEWQRGDSDLAVTVSGEVISSNDVRMLRSNALGISSGLEEVQTIQSVKRGFSVDGLDGIIDPVGMYGRILKTREDFIVSKASIVSNLRLSAQRSGIPVNGIIASPVAAGIACCSEDERIVGVTVIDIGAETTDIAVFRGGVPVFASSIKIGSRNVTNDIAIGLGVPVRTAEALKAKCGVYSNSWKFSSQTFDVLPLGEVDPDMAMRVKAEEIYNIIQPRMEELFEYVNAHLESGGCHPIGMTNVVFTGGGSNIAGLVEFAKLRFDGRIRVGTPIIDPTSKVAAASEDAVLFGMVMCLRNDSIESNATDSRFVSGDHSAGDGERAKTTGWLSRLLHGGDAPRSNNGSGA